MQVTVHIMKQKVESHNEETKQQRLERDEDIVNYTKWTECKATDTSNT